MKSKYSPTNTSFRSPNALLLSIRPEHANRIFEGSKRYELRKSLPSTPFHRVFLYETGGAGIVGSFDVGHIIHKPVKSLWRIVGNAGTTRERFFTYFAQVKSGFAIAITNPIRFRRPITIETLNGDFVRLMPPQSFMYLEPGQPLYQRVDQERQRTLQQHLPLVTLRKIKREQRDDYKRLVMKHISPNYKDIDASFAEANLKIHDLGFDPAGFFTVRKEVLAIYNEKDVCIGFTTLTYKSGGCTKTGPTILRSQHRKKGFGLATRKAIEDRVRKENVRKIYCTCPDTADTTIRYLLSSGMRIECHLQQHYANAHNELVFGKLLVADEPGAPSNREPELVAGEVMEATRFRHAQLANDFKSMFERTWSPVSIRFAKEVVRQAVHEKGEKPEQKPKRLVCAGAGRQCIAAIVLLPKRGGAVKGLLLRKTSHRETLTKLVQAALIQMQKLNGRKLYFLHPVADASVIELLRSIGFQAEGVIRAPYVPGQDVIVMAKFA